METPWGEVFEEGWNFIKGKKEDLLM